MAKRHALPVFLSLVVSVPLLAGCGGSSTLRAADLPGRLLIAERQGTELHELSRDPTTGKLRDVKVAAATSLARAAVSPDKHYLRYAQETTDAASGTGMIQQVIRDLRTGTETTARLPEAAQCQSWSPDTTSVSYVSTVNDEHTLYAGDYHSAHLRFITRAPSAAYSINGTGGSAVRLSGYLDCGSWIGPDRFLFQRFTGQMPATTTIDSTQLGANTTTLAVLGQDVTVTDAPERMSVVDVAADDSSVLLALQSPGDASGHVTQIAIVPPFDSFDTVFTRQLPCDSAGSVRCVPIGFVPNTSDVAVVEGNSDTDGHIEYIDAKTLQKRAGPRLPAGWRWKGTWVGDPRDEMIAIASCASATTGPCSLAVGNLKTGTATPLLPADTHVADPTDQILAWLPAPGDEPPLAPTPTPTPTPRPTPTAPLKPGTITEFLLPTIAGADNGGRTSGRGAADSLVAGPDGNVWFTVANTPGQIGRVAPDGTITEFPLPATSGSPRGLTRGPDGNLWFAEPSRNGLGYITPTGAITEMSLGYGAYKLTFDASGNLWFLAATDVIGRRTPTGEVTPFYIPDPTNGASDSGADALVRGPDGNLWFAESFADKIGRITPTGKITEFKLPHPNSGPYGLTVGPDGNLWFTEGTESPPIANGNKIGRITPTGKISEFPLPHPNHGPFGITAGPNKTIWFTEHGSDVIGFQDIHRIAEMSVSGVVLKEYTIPSDQSNPTSIVLGPDGNIWFNEYNAYQIGRLVV